MVVYTVVSSSVSGLITAARAVNWIYKQVLTMLNSHAVRSFNLIQLNSKQTQYAWAAKY